MVSRCWERNKVTTSLTPSYGFGFYGTVSVIFMITLLGQNNYKVNAPLVPVLVHDDFTRLTLIAILLPTLLYIVWKIFKYYDV